jgi:hypothetical protein
MMSAPLIRNLDLELSDPTHLAVHRPISVRESHNQAQAAPTCRYCNKRPSPALHALSRHIHEGKIFHRLRSRKLNTLHEQTDKDVEGLARLWGICALVLPFFVQERFLLLPSDSPNVFKVRTLDRRANWHALRLCGNAAYPNSTQSFTCVRGPDEKRRELLTAGAPSHTHSPGSCLGWSATFVRNP